MVTDMKANGSLANWNMANGNVAKWKEKEPIT